MILQDKFREMNSKQYTDTHSELFFSILTKKVISFKSSNKLNHIFDYEKMLGVNILNLSENGLLAGTIKEAEIRRLFYELKQGFYRYDHITTKPDLKYNRLVQKLNTLEFFLLSATYYGKAEKARAYKHNPYNSFPFNDFNNTDGVISYNFTAIVYNVVRYYNLLRKYILTRDKLGSSIIDDFFSIIIMVENDSIIYSIFSQLSLLGSETVKTTNKPHTYNIKKTDTNKPIIVSGDSLTYPSAIQNLEILEMLESYLGYIDKERSDNDDDNLKSIIEFFEKFAAFKYYCCEYLNNEVVYTEQHLNIFNKINRFLNDIKNSNLPPINVSHLGLAERDKALFFQFYNSSRNS